jgi:hypothetical protein
MSVLSFEHKFGAVLVFPVTDTQPAYQKPEVLAVLEALGSVTLGASTVEGVGYWQPTGEFERAIHVYTNYDGDEATLAQLTAAVLPVVAGWAIQTNQQAVALEFDSALQIWDTEDLRVQALLVAV